MNTFGVVVLLVAAASAHAGIIASTPIDTAAVISGPSGHIVRSGLGVAHAAPVVHSASLITAHAAPLIAAHAPLVAAHAPVAVAGVVPNSRLAPSGLIVPAGHGLEGQYVHDITEHLYDDGSYKPHVYGF